MKFFKTGKRKIFVRLVAGTGLLFNAIGSLFNDMDLLPPQLFKKMICF